LPAELSLSLEAISASDHIRGLPGVAAPVGVLAGGVVAGGGGNRPPGPKASPWYAGCRGCNGCGLSETSSGESGPESALDSDHSLPVSPAGLLCVGRSPSSLLAVPESFESATTVNTKC